MSKIVTMSAADGLAWEFRERVIDLLTELAVDRQRHLDITAPLSSVVKADLDNLRQISDNIAKAVVESL